MSLNERELPHIGRARALQPAVKLVTPPVPAIEEWLKMDIWASWAKDAIVQTKKSGAVISVYNSGGHMHILVQC